MEHSQVIVTIYPNAFGMGYVVCEDPKELINYGVARIRPLTKDKYVKWLYGFIKQYRPTLIILRDYDESDNRISKRIVRIIDKFKDEALKLDIPVYGYSRDQIKETFKQFGNNSKYGISKTIVTWYPELKHRMPDLRKNTKAEHYQMGVFDAFALMLTHHYLE
jgi:hypothetical protein